MKISIGDESLMNAAIHKVQEENILQALKLFAKVDSYESMLNQVGCLCELRDFHYAFQTYARLLSKYFSEYDCMNDMMLVGDSAEPVRTFFHDEPSYSLPARNRNKKSVNAELVCTFGAFELKRLLEDFDEYIERVGNYYFEPPADTFFDITSEEYFEEQYERLRKSFVRGDTAEYNIRKKNILDFSRDNSYTLQIKIITCFVDQDFETGVEYTRKLLELDDASIQALDCAARFLNRVDSCEYADILRQLILRVLSLLDEDDEYTVNLSEYLKMSLSQLKDNDLSCKLAAMLYQSEDVSVFSLKLCAVGFYNGGEYELAKRATRELLSCMPANAFGLMMEDFLNRDSAVKVLRFANYAGITYDAPIEFVICAQAELIGKAAQENPVYTRRDFILIDVLYDALRAAAITHNRVRQEEITDTIIGVLRSFNVEQRDSFEEFIRIKLADVLPCPEINAVMLSKLINLGFNKSLVITLDTDTYDLDLSRIKTDDKLFVEAFSVCATMRKISLRRLIFAYKSVMQRAIEFLPQADGLFAKQVAFCMLALGYKGFAESKTADRFTEDERKLYNDCFFAENS